MEGCLEKREPTHEGIEAMEEHQEIPNEEAASVYYWSTKGLIWGPATSLRILKLTEKSDPIWCCMRSP
jgi:hypothetical protein